MADIGHAITQHLRIEQEQAEFEAQCKEVKSGLVESKETAQEFLTAFLQKSQHKILKLPDNRYIRLVTKSSPRVLNEERIFTAVDMVTPEQLHDQIEELKTQSDHVTMQQAYIACLHMNLTVECFKYNTYPSIIKRLTGADKGPAEPRPAPATVVRQVAILENRKQVIKTLNAHITEGINRCELGKREYEPVIHTHMRQSNLSTRDVEIIDVDPEIQSPSHEVVDDEVMAELSFEPCLPPIPSIKNEPKISSTESDLTLATRKRKHGDSDDHDNDNDDNDRKKLKFESVTRLPSQLDIGIKTRIATLAVKPQGPKHKKPTYPQFRNRLDSIWDAVPISDSIGEKNIKRMCAEKMKEHISSVLADLLDTMTVEMEQKTKITVK